MAETTTTIWWPLPRPSPLAVAATRRATFLILSGSATDDPPYFCTITAMMLAAYTTGASPGKDAPDSEGGRLTPAGQPASLLQRPHHAEEHGTDHQEHCPYHVRVRPPRRHPAVEGVEREKGSAYQEDRVELAGQGHSPPEGKLRGAIAHETRERRGDLVGPSPKGIPEFSLQVSFLLSRDALVVEQSGQGDDDREIPRPREAGEPKRDQIVADVERMTHQRVEAGRVQDVCLLLSGVAPRRAPRRGAY